MAGQEKRQRHGKSEYQDQKRIDLQHHDQGTEDHDGTGAGLDQILRHGSVDGINIIGNVADDIAGLVLVKKTEPGESSDGGIRPSASAGRSSG